MILPLVAELLGRIGRRAEVEEALETLRRGRGEFRLSGLTDPGKVIVAAAVASASGRPSIVLVESNRRGEEFCEGLRYFYRAIARKPERSVAFLPAYDVLPYDGRSPHPQIAETRGVALWRFVTGEADILVAPIVAALMRQFDQEYNRQLARTLERDQEIPHQELLEYLESVGYERHETVEMPGQFAVRGGIVDIFSPETARPVRLELLGDTIESLREFDPNSQRSIQPLERATILPLSDTAKRNALPERLGESDAPVSGEDELPPAFFPGWEFQASLWEMKKSSLPELREEVFVIEEEPGELRTAAEEHRTRLRESYEKVKEESQIASAEHYVFSDDEWRKLLDARVRLQFEQLSLASGDKVEHVLPTQRTTRFHGNVGAFMGEVQERLQAAEQVIVSASSTGELERLADICHEYELPYRLGELEDSPTVARLAEEGSGGSVPAVVLVKAPLAEGVVFPAEKLALYGNRDLFETLSPPARVRQRPPTAGFFSDFSDLRAGDYVVHVDHGIGQFEGLRQIAVDGASGEFMQLRYADEAKLYVPLARLDLVQKYQSLGDATPALDRLGSALWEARKLRVRKSVDDLAEKLLHLYAERQSSPGHSYPGDTNWQREFEDAFDFEETPDQASAIEEVKRDLEASKPMDRLLCGDVGYGKTEVAMRAAFKAVTDSRQVAILAPTTVLAFQHYETFRARFAAFPVRIEMLSRFRSRGEQKKVLGDVEAGRVDIVIGTHRLLSRDVRFHDLGLLVVDEEQRFGVAHKERLKELRKNVDVLTMSATPIPRTLHMSLVGLRDMSVIETPPKDRLAIQTSVAPFSESLIQRAIEVELGRGGQVFFVHNRVESIASLAALVKRLAPKARVVVGHGQMKESELEKVMLKFIRHEADILVSTTIIENGLDIPNANTILINRADRFGLAELYQLRGRVGRSNQRAYAYLLVPPEAALSPLARQRLAALKEFSELGAGFRIAALDLELRGAGNLLGRQQHGHIEAVGFELYCQMLERAVAERKGEAVRPELRSALNLGQEIRIPPEYIESENLRLRIYKRIASISSEAERDEVRRELEDRFGPLPTAVENLLDYAVLKALAEKLLVSSVERRGDQLVIQFHEETPVRPEKLVGVIRGSRDLRLDPSGVLWVGWKRDEGGVTGAARKVLLQLQS